MPGRVDAMVAAARTVEPTLQEIITFDVRQFYKVFAKSDFNLLRGSQGPLKNSTEVNFHKIDLKYL